MPTSQAHARNLIRKGEAHVVKIFPYIIQLTKATGENKQKISLGVDAGSKTVGFSVITDKKEIVAKDLNLDQNTSKRLTERKMYRRNRRNRLRYRKPRFDNRKKPAGWLSPSTKRKFDAHVTLVNALKELLPIDRVTVEIGNFDIQKLMDPEISGKEYQQGNLFGYNNLKTFLIVREKGKCQICGKEVRGEKVNLHHIIQRSDGGSDRPENRALLHEGCHKKMHKNNSCNLLKKNNQYKDATFMSIVGGMFQKALDCEITYGYKTKTKRDMLGIGKSHVNDAFVIAGGTTQERCVPSTIEQKRRNNRALQTNRKGFAPSIRRKRHSIQNRDFVWIGRKKYLCGG